MSRVLIVGASAAGFSAADALRRLGFEGEIVIAGDEPPYDRPPLSKQVLKGDWEPSRAVVMPPARAAALNAITHFDKRAVGLDLDGRSVRFMDGAQLEYDQLVIATGVRPRRLPGDCGAVHVLRTLEDAAALRTQILQHKSILIVGAGFIGLEVASTAVAMGARVRVIEPVSEPLRDRIGAHAARRLLDLHVSAGVELSTGIGVRDIRDFSDGAVVTLSSGEAIESPAVVVGIGCEPNVDWLEGSGLTLDNGVVCDAYCAAAPNVWAAGDVARWHHAGIGRSVRIEHRTNAQEQAAAVARNMLGERQPFTPAPFFWSDQYDVKLQSAGFLPQNHDEENTIELGDADGPSFVRAFYSKGRLCAVVGWNAAKAMPSFRAKLTFAAPQAAHA